MSEIAATWTHRNGTRTSGTFFDVTPDQVRTTIAHSGGTGVTVLLPIDPRPVTMDDTCARVRRIRDGRTGTIEGMCSWQGQPDEIDVEWDQPETLPNGYVERYSDRDFDGARDFLVIALTEDQAAEAHEAATLDDQARHEVEIQRG